MRVGVRIPPSRPLPEIASVVRRAEEAGFDTAAMPDCPTLWRDTMLALASAAVSTERITLSSAVSNVVTRTAIGLASEARTIGELAPGRFRLSIGTGLSSVFLTGQRPSTTRAFRAGVETVTALLRDGKARIGDTEVERETVVELQDPGDPDRPIPIYVAADGPRNLALGAEIADGVMTTYRDIEGRLGLLRDRMRAVGRDRPLARVLIATTRVTDDLESELPRLKPFIARIVEVEGPELFEQAGFEVRLPGPGTLADGTDLGHPRDVEEAQRLASQWISDDLAVWCATNLCLIGSGPEIVDRLRALSALGFDEVLMSDGTSFVPPVELIDRIGAEVIPALRGVGSSGEASEETRR